MPRAQMLPKGWLAPDGEFVSVLIHEDIFSDEILRAEAEGTDAEALENAYDELMVKEGWIRVDSEGNGFHGTLKALRDAASHIEGLISNLRPDDTFNVDVMADTNRRLITARLTAGEVFEMGFAKALDRDIRSRLAARGIPLPIHRRPVHVRQHRRRR